MDFRKFVRQGFHILWPSWLPLRALRIRHCGFTVFLDPADYSAREIYVRYLLRRRWTHETFQQQVTRQILAQSERAWFVDAGASYGMYSLLAAESGFKEHVACVIAIEASPRTFRWLQRTIDFNRLQGRITPLHNAVSDTDGLELVFRDHPNFSEWGSVGGSTQQDAPPSDPVLSRRLDSVLAESGWTPTNPLVLKIDIEGGEPDALRGLGSVPSEAVDFVVIVEFQSRLLDARPDGSARFADQLLSAGAPFMYELNEARQALTPLANRPAFEALVARLRSGTRLRDYMTNIILSSRPVP